MRSSEDRRRSMRSRRRLAVLVGAASLLGFGASLPADAQTPPPGKTGEELFGAYELDARGLGAQGSYLIEGLIPGGAAVIDLGIPETVASFRSGYGYGLASLAYPGGILANFGSLVAQSGGPGDDVPPYPVKAEAFYPAGPTKADGSQPGGFVQNVTADAHGVLSTASFPAIEAPPVVSIGSITSASRGGIEGELAVSRSRVVLGNVRILGGVITIDSVITDLVAAHDGQTGSTAGGTTASGVKFLGLDATLTGDGLVLKKAPPAEGPAAPLGGALSEAAGPLAGAVGPVQEQLAKVLQQATPSVDELLARAGITVKILEPSEAQIQSGAATKVTSGLSVGFSYKGREQQAMVDLVNSIPAELKPNFGPIPNPVTFLAENHIYGVALAPATVSSLATPPFPELTIDLQTGDVADLVLNPGFPGTPGTPGFTTPAAPLPAPGAGSAGGPLDPISNAASEALPAILVALALLVSPFFGMGSSRLADTVLAQASTSCPLGLDQPPAPPRLS